MLSRNFLVTLMLATLVIAACGSDGTIAASTPSSAVSPTVSILPSSSPSPSTSSPSATEITCGAIRAGYTKWNALPHPKTAADLHAADRATFDDLMGSGDEFYDVIRGYPGQLAVAVAEYNSELGLANLQQSVRGQVPTDQARKVIAATKKVHEAYKAFITSTCS